MCLRIYRRGARRGSFFNITIINHPIIKGQYIETTNEVSGFIWEPWGLSKPKRRKRKPRYISLPCLLNHVAHLHKRTAQIVPPKDLIDLLEAGQI